MISRSMRKDHYVARLSRERNRLLDAAAQAPLARRDILDRVDQIEEEIKELTGRTLSHTWLYSSNAK